MWHEARKQEKHIRSILIDYRKRAERRQDFYARIRQDPIKFLRVYGTRAKINLDADIVKAAENPKTMMRWTADPSVVIDRFDARANLDQYSEPTLKEIKLTTLEKIEERLCNYERYRCLVQNDFLGVTEAMTLKQIEMDEKFGDLEERKKAKEEEEEKKKKLQEGKAAINFVYEENEPLSGTAKPVADDSSESECEADSDMDIDVELDLSTLTGEQRRRLCKHGLEYKMKSSDFIRLLDADQQLETELRLAKAMEEEKSHLVMLGGCFLEKNGQSFFNWLLPSRVTHCYELDTSLHGCPSNNSPRSNPQRRTQQQGRKRRRVLNYSNSVFRATKERKRPKSDQSDSPIEGFASALEF